MDRAALTEARILVVDDQQQNVLLLEQILEQAGYTNVRTTTDSSQVVALCAHSQPDLILLDLHMPEPDGFEVMGQLTPWLEGCWFPILVLTADITPEAKQRALSVGAKDFVTKPFDQTEVLLRIENLLRVRFLEVELRKQNLVLEQRVYERTQDLQDARLSVLDRLAVAAEYRDDDTREHTRRVGRTSALIARSLGLPEEEVELIRVAAPLHDVGKIGIPDRILLKPGKLTPQEFAHMQEHVKIGRSILSGSPSPILEMSAQIALTHHEWWNCSGYPSGLEGTDIPLTGRIVAVADVFDALTHDRPYKGAWPVERAVAEIQRLSGSQFDPRIVEAFELLDPNGLAAPIAATEPREARILSAAS